MKRLIILFLCITSFFIESLVAQPDFNISEGIYRIPYADGTEITIGRDHLTHSPLGRIDMNGTGGSDYQIVAAAEGWIYAIEDDYTATIACDSTTPASMQTNNYVWIEHPNGEFTKYSHMRQNTTTDDADLSVGDYVCAGQFLGIEDAVGCAGGDHLHFEVARPTDGTGVLTFTTIGGFINGSTENLIPVICGISNNVFLDDADYTANPCDYNACFPGLINLSASFGNDEFDVDIASTSISTSVGSTVNFFSGSNGIYQAGEYVLLREGFTAYVGSQFIARIRTCNNPGYDVACTPSGKIAASAMELNTQDDFLKVFPNPTADVCTISWHAQNNAGEFILHIYSVQGILIASYQSEEELQHITLNTSSFAAGTYKCVLINNGKLVATELLIVAR